MANSLLERLGNFRSWVENIEISNHMLVLFQFEVGYERSRTPFKFNHSWLEEKSFIELVRDRWNTYDLDFLSVM